MSEKTDEKGLIQLAPLFEEQKKLEAVAAAAIQVASEATGKLNTYNFSALEKLRADLAAGGTTGDVFQDQMLRIFGLDKAPIAAMTEFNSQLISAKGHKMVIEFSYAQRIRYGGPGDLSERDYMTVYSHVLGILSGAPLQVIFDEYGSVKHFALPFERHVTRGMDRPKSNEKKTDDMKPIEGPYLLEAGYIKALTEEITRMEIFATAVNLARVYKDVNSKHLILPDNGEYKLLAAQSFERLVLSLDGMIDALEKATPAEQVEADGI